MSIFPLVFVPVIICMEASDTDENDPSYGFDVPDKKTDTVGTGLVIDEEKVTVYKPVPLSVMLAIL